MINFCLCHGYIAPIVSRHTDLARRDNPSNVQGAVPASGAIKRQDNTSSWCWPELVDGKWQHVCANYHRPT